MPQLEYQRVQAAIRQVDLAGLAPTMLAFMKANVASNALVFIDQHGVMSKPGCIIASPSFSGVTDQDYVHHWTRDAAITAVEIAESLPVDSGIDQTLCDYVSFSQICQANAINSGHFFRAAFQIDGNVRDWSDQKDGPALQSLAFVAAWPFLDDPSKATAKKVAQRNLDETVRNWDNDVQVFGPWEDVQGASFFARSAQVRFLREVQSTNTLSLNPPADFESALEGLTNALDTHWDDAKGLYRSIPDGVAGDPAFTDVRGFDPNTDTVMACIYGSISCTDPKLLATAAKVRAVYDVGGSTSYPINKADRDDSERGFGPMVGRYPSDTYDGDVGKDKQHPTKDHPWALCTANFAQLCYLVARSFESGRTAAYDELTGPFFDQSGLDAATVNNPADTSTVADALRTAGDEMLQAVIFHSDHYRLSEQFDGTTGFEKSVSDLTWSYAACLRAMRTR